MGDNNTNNKFDLYKNSGFRKAKMFIIQKLLLNSYENIKYKHSDRNFRLNIIKFNYPLDETLEFYILS